MKVTAIMPTRGRCEWALQALRSFLAQTHDDKEIVIVDDADERSFASRPVDPEGLDRIRYQILDRRLSIPEKRNHCCELASGDVIMHWDSDDWSAKSRMADQLARLEKSELAVGGYYAMLFWDHQNRLGYRYKGSVNYAIGTSLAYRREWWSDHKFRFPPDVGHGEDNEFVRMAREAAQIQCADAGPLMVARIHAGNTAVKNRSGGIEYQSFPTNQFPREFFF